MNAHISHASGKGKWYITKLLPLVLSLLVFVGIYSFTQFSYPITAQAAVTLNTTNQISGSFPGEDETTHFMQGFYSTGSAPTDITFVGKYWPVGNSSNPVTVSNIGSRAANTPPTALREVFLKIQYAGSSIVPGAAYEYHILDTNGNLYYKGSFIRPNLAGPAAASTVAVTSALSADGRTVTFTVTGTSSVDVDFYFKYHSNANATYSGYVEDIATRSAGATAPQTFEYTLGVPGQSITDLQGFVIDPATVTYDLSDTDSGQIYVSGFFGPDPAASGTTTGGTTTGGTTAVVAQPTNYGVNKIINLTPDQSGGLVPCDGRGINRCTWAKLVELVNKGLTWLIYMTVPIAAGMFAYAGFLFLTKGSSEEARGKAKGIFINVFIGILFIVGSVLIIKTILTALIDPNVGDGYSSFL